MNAVLNIYEDCTSEKPTKQYVCRRLLFGASQKIQELSKGLEKKSEEEQTETNIDILKTIFPHFEDEDFYKIDPVEWFKFVNEIGNETNQAMNSAVKK